MHQERNPTTVSPLLTQIQDLQNKVNSLSDAREFKDPETGSNSGATHVLDCRTVHGILCVLKETFWTTTCSRRTNLYPLQQFKEFGILFSRIETWYYRKYQEAGEWNETRTAEFVNSCTTLPKWRWIIGSGWWNLFSQWYEWLSEIPDCGSASGKISWLDGISKLESQLQDWSMFKISRSSSHNALDQRSWDSKVNWRTYDIAIDCGAKRFPRLRCAWCDDCVCIENTSRQACSLPQKSICRRAACSKIRPILTRETICLHDLRAFLCNRSLWSGTRTLGFVQYTFAEWRRPRNRRSVGSSSILSNRHAFRCDPERIVQVKTTGLCSPSDRLGFLWSRNRLKYWTNKLFTIEDVCKTSYWSDDENSKLQSLKRCCGKRSSHQEFTKES